MTPSPDPIPPAGTPARPEYEFTAAQNEVIDGLAGSLTWLGIPLYLVAAVYAARSGVHFSRVGQSTAELVPAGAALLGVAFFVLMGSWLQKAGAAFDRVTRTSGFDIGHLMAGLQNLRKTFGVIGVIAAVYFGFLILEIITVVVAGFTAPA